MELLNTLYVTTQHSYLHLDHDTVRVEVERNTVLRLPLLHLQAIVSFGDVLLSPALLHRCGEDGRAVVLLGRNGRFKCRLVGPTGGNVLLRRAQHLALSDPDITTRVARSIVAGKIQNARAVMQRAGREATSQSDASSLRVGTELLADALRRLEQAADLDAVRGCEGDAARVYFDRFGCMVRGDRQVFGWTTRTRRPPRDPMNATLSFLYALLVGDCVAALEGVGLDPQVGYLHALRPGRPALALDLLEELRAAVADRLALTLVNRKQLSASDFDVQPGGAVLLNDKGRREVIAAYQTRKQEEVRHRVLDRMVPLGLVPHMQARLLARFLREDIPDYIPHAIR